MIAFGLGTGFSPVAPGTVASAVAALAHHWILAPLPIWLQASAVTLAFGLGTWAACRIERRSDQHDDRAIVCDEIVGVWLALTACGESWIGTVVGFALFRLFDIWKPWPISWLDRRVPGGLGVMVDDVAAGAAAAAAAWATLAFMALQTSST